MTIHLLAKQAGVSVYVAREYAEKFLGISKDRKQYTMKEGNDLLYALEKWQSGAAVCSELAISRQWLFRLKKDHGLPCKDFGGKTYYDKEVVREYVKRLNKK